MKKYSRVTDQGTAMYEATLCERHYVEPFIERANVQADAADDVHPDDRTWHDSTDNDDAECPWC